MNHLPEVLKILEGALKQSPQQAIAYARSLIQKLELDGEHQQARMLQRKLDTTPARMVALSSGNVGSVPVDNESQLDLAEIENILDDEPRLLLDEHLRAEVDRFLADVEHMDLLASAGIQTASRMLIYGPPGVGKTQLARYVAGILRLPLLTARSDSLISSYLGSTAKNIRRLFDHAAERPCVLFLDEFDALAKARDDAHELGELKRVVVSLLQNIDSLPFQTVLLAATNHEQLLDSAVWRRFNYRLEVHLPNSILREALLREYLGSYAPPSSLDHAVNISEGLSGGLLRQAVGDCIREAVIARKTVTEPQLLKRLSQIVLNAKRELPSRDGIADFLLKARVPLRTVADATGLSMRQLLKRNKLLSTSVGQQGPSNGERRSSGDCD